MALGCIAGGQSWFVEHSNRCNRIFLLVMMKDDDDEVQAGKSWIREFYNRNHYSTGMSIETIEATKLWRGRGCKHSLEKRSRDFVISCQVRVVAFVYT